MRNNTVLVIGGGGFYGRYLVNDLLQHTNADIIIASRNPPDNWPDRERVRVESCDMADLAALERLAAQCRVVAHCAGPFPNLPLNPLHAAINTGTDYVDISEDRNFLKAVRALEGPIQQAGITVFNGMSVAPGMEALFAQLMSGRFDRLHSVRTFAAPDTRKHRGRAMFATMLYGVGRFGKDEGGVIFEVQGYKDNKLLTHRIAVMARHDGGLIPSVLAGIATARLLAGESYYSGIVPVHNWISPDALITQLTDRGLEIWQQPPDSAEWQPVKSID